MYAVNMHTVTSLHELRPETVYITNHQPYMYINTSKASPYNQPTTTKQNNQLHSTSTHRLITTMYSYKFRKTCKVLENSSIWRFRVGLLADMRRASYMSSERLQFDLINILVLSVNCTLVGLH